MAATTGVTIRVISNKLPALSDALAKVVRDERVKVAMELEADWKAHVPVRTGTYRRSVHTVADATPDTSVVGTSVHYGKYVEFGTRRMAARPAARPAAEKARQRLPARIKAAVQRAAG